MPAWVTGVAALAGLVYAAYAWRVGIRGKRLAAFAVYCLGLLLMVLYSLSEAHVPWMEAFLLAGVLLTFLARIAHRLRPRATSSG